MRVHILGPIAVLAVALVACGGSGAAPDAATTGASEPTQAPAAETAAPTTDAIDATASTEGAPTTEPAGGGSGGFASRPCDLVSQADAETAAGVGGLIQSVLQIDATSGICTYQDTAKGIEVYAGVWDRDAAEAQWAAMQYLVDAGTPDIEKVEGLGGDAIYSTSGSVLLVRKGDTLVQLTVRNPDLDEAANKAAVVALGRAVLGHM
jgi:hypothetical protein